MLNRAVRMGMFAWLGVVTCTLAGEHRHTDPSGFSLRYPEDWRAITRFNEAEILKELPEPVRGWLASNRIDLNKIVVFMFPGNASFAATNVNVTVDNQEVSLTKKAAEQFAANIPGQYASHGIKIRNLKTQLGKCGSRDALISEYDATFPGVGPERHQKQYLIPGGGKTFTITLTANTDSFAQYQAKFDEILDSFECPPAKHQGFAWDGVIGNAAKYGLIYGVIGGIVGGVVAGTMALLRKFRKPAKDA